MDIIYWDHYYNHILLINLLIVTGLFTSLRLFSGVIAHIDASKELLTKDNPAFGISLAAATFGVTIMLSGTIYGSPDDSAFDAISSFAVFGLAGIAMMAVTRLIFDKITLPRINLRDEIVAGNKAVAIADAGNILAMAIIIRAIMIWVTVNSLEGVLALLGGYAVSQFLLAAMTILRMKVFGKISQGACLQEELQKGNIALALRFAGRKIGTAFAIATAAQIVVYEEYEIIPILAAWLLASIAVIIVWEILCFVAEKIILFRVNDNDEVIRQRNIALGALQGIIYISLGLLIATL